LHRVHGEAVSLTRAGGEVVVTLADGRRVEGDVTVLATGYALKQPADIPHVLPSWAAFEPEALAKVRHVLILGTGHSAIDHVQSLAAAGYAGKITLMSRHGFLPAVHKPIEPASIDVREFPFGARLSDVWRWVRRRAAEAEGAGGDWRSVLDGLRPHAQAFWQSLAPVEQRRFIRHARAWYDVRRHRLAPSITAGLERLQAEGRLEVIAGRVLSATDIGESASIVYRRRGERAEETLTVDAIIECTGFDLNPATAQNPLLSDLLAQGLAQPGPHGFGLKVDATCALIDADGHAANDLFAIGPLTRGQFWEIVGLPDIRLRCVRLGLALGAAARPAAAVSA